MRSKCHCVKHFSQKTGVFSKYQSVYRDSVDNVFDPPPLPKTYLYYTLPFEKVFEILKNRKNVSLASSFLRYTRTS